MIEFYITEQSIRFASPVIAANALDYLEARFHFSGSDWDGCSKWAHFRQGETVYDLNLENDAISAEMHLNLSVGRWEVYVTGNRGESRLTTVPVILTVRESGLVDEPLHLIPQTVAEQVDNKAELALQKAAALEEAAASGRFDGKSFHVLGYFESFEELEKKVEHFGVGDSYCVGTEPPYSLYIYDGIGERWVNNGAVIGMKGDRGPSGTTFTPQVSTGGNLSWINDGGLENPEVVNIMGPQGETGAPGAPGKSPYELAVQEGFSGTEETFNWSLANIAAHGKGHEAGGGDPIRVTQTMLANGAVTADKVASGAITAAKLAEHAVTRDKLAADAAYSPTKAISATGYAISASDGGKTLWTSSNQNFTLSLGKSTSMSMPNGIEIAVTWILGTGVTISFTEGLRIAMPGQSSFVVNASVKISERSGMIALKKIVSDATNGDLWLVQGLAEVVT